MLVQLNRQPGVHDFSATATDLPINPGGLPRARGPLPVVAVLGHPGRVAGLPQHLPGGWSLRPVAEISDVQPDEIVLFAGARVREIEAARRELPSRTLIVALVDDEAPGPMVAEVLTAGADVCVRGGQPAILAGHLVAARRRQLAERWSRLDEQIRH
jgi:hypothetical protein